MAARAGARSDWLVEGLAEYYSLEIMHRSGTITPQRYEKAHEQLAEYGEKASTLEVERSHGPITAKAVSVLRALDNEIREKTNNTASLDNVVKALTAQRGDITLERVRKVAEQVAGVPLETLDGIP
jgi:predicted metalloprotease with PDZ domain